MRIENDWLNEEESRVFSEHRKPSKCKESITYLKLVIMMSALFFCTFSLDAAPYQYSGYPKAEVVEGGVWFMCRNCRTCQWQDSRNMNWRGEFFCLSCGAKYDE